MIVVLELYVSKIVFVSSIFKDVSESDIIIKIINFLSQLRGCCLKGKERLLVYEYLQNRSLYQALFSA